MPQPRPYQLTKSRLLSFRQCPKKLHLETYRRELATTDAALQRIFDQGHEVGQKARELYGPGPVMDIKGEGGALAVVAETRRLLTSSYRGPVYEAGFLHEGVLVLADVVIVSDAGLRAIEVKSSTSVKDINLFDCAVQSWVMAGAGFPATNIFLAHINSGFVYAGDDDYRGLFTEVAVDEEVRGLAGLVPSIVASAKGVLANPEPVLKMGPHCYAPYACSFESHCEGTPAEYPIHTLPRIGKRRWALEAEGFRDIRDIPAERLSNPNQLRVWHAVRNGKAELNPEARKLLSRLEYPRYYLDFETIGFAVPIWADTRPYEQLPFQWSCKIERAPSQFESADFLDLSGQPPMRACAEKLLATLGSSGAIITYSAFEARVIGDLAKRFPDLAPGLKALLPRLTDLLPITRDHYYHPRMAGSWSIKSVLPTIAPDLDYALLDGVQDGGGAQAAYLEAVGTSDPGRKEQLKDQLLRYCGQDVEAMVRVAKHFCEQYNDS